MVWLVLVLAGALEVAWSLGLKYTHGFTRPLPSALTGAAIVASMVLLARATRTLPIGTAYAIWVGIGVVGATLGGLILHGEALPPRRAIFLALLVISILGLKLTAPPAEPATAISPPSAPEAASAAAGSARCPAPAPPAAAARARSDRAW